MGPPNRRPSVGHAPGRLRRQRDNATRRYAGTAAEAGTRGPLALPIVGWSSEAIRVAVWEREEAWSRVERYGWARPSDIAQTSWGVWLSREELLALLRRVL